MRQARYTTTLVAIHFRGLETMAEFVLRDQEGESVASGVCMLIDLQDVVHRQALVRCMLDGFEGELVHELVVDGAIEYREGKVVQ